ncbi:MAG: LysR family transcriptional regulator [Thiolinea sp.]
MKTSQNLLPSTSQLKAFESVARNGSVSAAARELSLTQGAVSRLIQKLENQLTIQLFHRVNRRMELTTAGNSYAPDIRRALDIIATASLTLRANPAGGTLRLAILPTMGTRWLAPLLPEFLAQHPGITLNLTTKLEPFDFAHEPLDAAVHFGHTNWEGVDYLKLFDEALTVVAAPGLLKEHPCNTPEDVLALPLLHLKSRPHAWDIWMQHYRVEHPPLSGMMIDQFATLSQMAVQGLGLALLPRFLIGRELESGSLVNVFQDSFSSADIGAYYLVWPKVRSDYPPLQTFNRWLASITTQ